MYRNLKETENEIEKVKHKINLEYCNLGKSIYQIFEIESKKIDELFDELIELKKDLAKLESEGGLDEQGD